MPFTITMSSDWLLDESLFVAGIIRLRFRSGFFFIDSNCGSIKRLKSLFQIYYDGVNYGSEYRLNLELWSIEVGQSEKLSYFNFKKEN